MLFFLSDYSRDRLNVGQFCRSLRGISFHSWLYTNWGHVNTICLHHELVGPSKRTAAGNLEFLFFNGLQSLFIIIAYFIRDWRMLTLAATLPGALLFPFWK